MTRYVVVTRQGRLPVSRDFITVEAAADYITHEQGFDRWEVLAQDANRITSSTPFRPLRPTEQARLEVRLFPGLH